MELDKSIEKLEPFRKLERRGKLKVKDLRFSGKNLIYMRLDYGIDHLAFMYGKDLELVAEYYWDVTYSVNLTIECPNDGYIFVTEDYMDYKKENGLVNFKDKIQEMEKINEEEEDYDE